MKHIFALIFAVALALPAYGQSPTFIFEDFTAASLPEGWEITGDFFRKSDGGYNSSASFCSNINSTNSTATVTISNIDLGVSPVLEFKYRATNYNGITASSNTLKYTVSVFTNNWVNVKDSIMHSSSSSFQTISIDLSTYANSSNFKVRISFTVVGDNNILVFLDDVIIIGTKHTVTFDANGGTVSSASNTTGSIRTSLGSLQMLGSLPTPTKTDYYFDGWFTETTGGTQVETNTVFSSDSTIYAQWLPEYTITYNLDGGTNSTSNPVTYNSKTPTIALNSPTRSDYVFSGWYDNSSFTGTPILSIPIGSTGNKEYWAKWVPTIVFSETFESSNSFTIVNDSQTNYWVRGSTTSYGGSYSAYISNNSYSSENSYSTNSSSIIHLYKDITFPVSTSDFTLTFYFKGNGEQVVDCMTVRYDITNNTPSAGSEFTSGTLLGTYNNNPNWTPVSITLPAADFSNTTKRLVFTWKNDGSGGTQPPAAIDNISIQNTAGSFVPVTNITANVPISILTGASVSLTDTITPANATNKMLFWSVENAGSTGVNIVGNVLSVPQGAANGTVTIRATAKYGLTSGDYTKNFTITIPAYTVTFDPNGGTVTSETSTTGTSWRLASLPTPTRTGYTFNGWFTDTTGSTQVTTSTTFSSNSTIYARWAFKNYTITFNTNGGSLYTSSGQTGEGWKLSPLPTPTRSGYNFVGWFTQETDGTEVTTSTEFSENTTIYARWALIITITPSSLDNARKGESYSQSLSFNSATSVSSATWSIDGGALPTGLTLNSATGTISGTPSVAGIFNFTVKADIGTSSGTKDFSIHVGNIFSFSESFENGTNGWVLVNGSQTNKWMIGTATSYSDSYSAYISNDDGVSNYYNASYSSTVHLYKDFTFPVSSSDFTMTFYFKGYGYGSSYDYMTVKYSTTSYTPTAGSTFYADGTTLGTYYGNTSWTQKTITLPAATFSGKTMRLVFTWVNYATSSSYYQPPAAIDSINIISSNILTVPSPIIVTSSLPSGVQGIVCNRSFALEEVGMPVTWSISSGALPAGLTLNSATGVISGIPTSAGTFNFTVAAHNGETSGSKSLSIQIVSVNSVFEQLNIPTIITAREPLALSSVAMHNATQALTYRVINAGTTGATISNDTLNTTASGTILITVSIDENNERSFTIMVLPVGTLAISNGYSPLAASNSPTYYNIRGIPLGSKKPATPGVYIEKRGYVSKKIVVP
jgi:uncharacterized repeat protein (TIGR02543 family)